MSRVWDSIKKMKQRKININKEEIEKCEDKIINFLIYKQIRTVDNALVKFMFKNHLFYSDMVENIKRICKQDESFKEYWYYKNIPIISTEIKFNCYE